MYDVKIFCPQTILLLILRLYYKMRISRNNTSNTTSRRNDLDPKTRSRSMSSRSLSNTHIESKFYFCHYRNAMYMGGMKSFQKNGLGIIIHDNGYSVVCNHYNDFKHGHHIIYGQNCLMSVLYNKNKIIECVFRSEVYLLFIRFNKEQQPEGKTILFDYQNRAIFYVTYRKGTLVQKREEKQYSILNRVFELENLEFLIGIIHSKALRYEIEDNQHIQCQKMETKFNIGFYKRGLLNGLGFTLLSRQPSVNLDTHRLPNHLYLRPLERGYFHNSQLCGMGEKWFKNGNYYFGDFKENIFEGRGILKNSAKNNWVYGSFEKGNMSELIQYSHEGDLARFKKLIQSMHERKSTWINNEITVQSPDIFMKEIERILNNKTISQIKNLQQRKQQVLKRIQQNFICENPQNILASSRHVSAYNEISADSRRIKSQKLHQNEFSAKQSRQKSNSEYQSPPQNTSGANEMSPINQIKAQQPQTTERTGQKSRYKIKLLEIPTTNDQSSERRRQTSLSPIKYTSNQMGNMKYSQRTMNFSQIKEEQPTYLHQERKMIGRSRLFKYLPKDSQEKPPHFSYVPVK